MYELPEGVHIILEPPPHPDGDLGVRYHPEGCLAALLHHQHHPDPHHHRLQAQEGRDHASVSDAGHRPLRHESEPSHTRSGHESGTQEAREGSPAPNPSLGEVQSKVLGMVDVEGAGADDIQGYGNNSFRGHGVGSSGPWTSGSIGSGDVRVLQGRVADHSDSRESHDPEPEVSTYV